MVFDNIEAHLPGAIGAASIGALEALEVYTIQGRFFMSLRVIGGGHVSAPVCSFLLRSLSN